MKRARIVVGGLTKTFRDGGREVAAVQDVSFEILDQEFVAIVGPSGCGKSTTLNMIAGLIAPTAGTVALMLTIVVEPQILLMDEPVGALDTHTKINLHAEFLALWGERHQTVVFVTHDLSEAITLADRVVVMTRRPGRIKLIHEVKLRRPRDVISLRERDDYGREYRALWHVLGGEFARPAS